MNHMYIRVTRTDQIAALDQIKDPSLKASAMADVSLIPESILSNVRLHETEDPSQDLIRRVPDVGRTPCKKDVQRWVIHLHGSNRF